MNVKRKTGQQSPSQISQSGDRLKRDIYKKFQFNILFLGLWPDTC